MDKKATLDTIARFQKAIESRGINISKLILYGSYARGDFQEGAAVDVHGLIPGVFNGRFGFGSFRGR